MARPSYMQAMYGRPRRAPHPRPYQRFFPRYTLPPIARLARPPDGAPRVIPGTNVPLMGFGEELPSAVVVPDALAKAYVEATWPHLQPRIQGVAKEAGDAASLRAAMMAGGVALVVLLTSYWIKKG